MARPALRRVVLLVVGAVVALVCVRLGIWQLQRLSERQAFNDRVEAGLAQSPAPLDEVLAEAVADPEALEYRRVVVTGTYDGSEEVVLYGRTLNGRPGDHLLTPLVLDDGTAIVVDRGWVPFEPDRSLPADGPASAHAGPVTVEGFLTAPDEATAPGEPVTTIQRIDLERLQGQMPYELVPLALQLEAQTPSASLPVPAPRPVLSPGPHLSYAIQWFAFATIAAGGAVLIARRDRADDRRSASNDPPDDEEGR